MNQQLTAIVSRFLPEVQVAGITPLGNGLINDTYRVSTLPAEAPDYVLQRINEHVFTDVDALQRNIDTVTAHLRRKLSERGADLQRSVLQFVKTPDGSSYLRDDEGQPWRLSVFISDAVTLDEVTPQSAFEAGRAFGDYEQMLSDLPPSALTETIPHFHDMEYRLHQLRQAIASDPVHRVAEVSQTIAFIEQHAERMLLAQRLEHEGRLPRRFCHCDTKVNNMMFDAQTGRFLLVVDLDTTMPSLFYSDYGDFLRTAASTTAEDDPQLDHIRFRFDIFEAFTRGYLQTAGTMLTPLEVELLPFAVELFPYMQGVRFLWDYLQGDHYWKCRYPTHNLDRALNQLRLYKEVCRHEPQMKAFLSETLLK